MLLLKYLKLVNTNMKNMRTLFSFRFLLGGGGTLLKNSTASLYKRTISVKRLVRFFEEDRHTYRQTGRHSVTFIFEYLGNEAI